MMARIGERGVVSADLIGADAEFLDNDGPVPGVGCEPGDG